MHELSLLSAVVSTVEKAATKDHITRINAVCLLVGTMSGAVPEALRGSWPIATANTSLENTSLHIKNIQAAVWCPTCKADQPIDEFFALSCPVCSTPTANLSRGREFEIEWVDWEVEKTP